MARFLRFGVYATLSFIPIVSSRFTEPSSDVKDFTQRWFVGDTMKIAWDAGWNWGVGTQPEVVDLFITWFDDTIENTFWKRLDANISLDTPGGFDWKVDLVDSVIASSTQYHLRFLEHTEPADYSLKASRLPSRGFNIYPNPSSSSSTETSSTVSSSTLTTAASTSETSSSSAQSASPSPSSSSDANTSSGSSTNVGAIAGGVVGGLAGLALICGIALLFLRTAKRKQKAAAAKPDEVFEKPTWEDDVKRQQWAHTGTPGELDGSSTNELQGSTPREWH
ncbi:hypothetical protein IQ07DRAFT_596889 [Pyrenochaeta sp. DS3sAY3a]|nr:hypothetical protein IQ07DRAFT_596889 [Pyrenochaeta sp. DS3sAY3a]